MQYTPKRQRPNKNREESSSSQTTINDLPTSILIHILSFLPSTDAAIPTSAVAPPWRNLWQSIPTINFDILAFQFRGAPLLRSEARKLFAETINTVLFQRPNHFALKKFKLAFDYRDYDYLRSYVDSWLEFVIRLKPEEIDLDFKNYRGSDYNCEHDEDEFYTLGLLDPYVFHYMALVNISVKVLRLRCCDISRSPGIPSSSKVHSLREIYLAQILSFTSEELGVLLASCVNLEILSLVEVDFKGDWKLESQSLKHFEFEEYKLWSDLHDNSIEICAPKLESLILRDAYEGMYSLKVSSSLVSARVEFSARCWRGFANWANIVCSLGGVEWLAIQNMWCRSRFDGEHRIPLDQNHEIDLAKYLPAKDYVFSESFVFHKLKHVELVTGFLEYDTRGLEILLGKCPQLETMALVNIFASYKSNELTELAATLSASQIDRLMVADTSIVFQMPRLRLVEMKMFQETEGEKFVVDLLKKYGNCLERIVAYPEKVDGESRVSYVL